MHPGGGRNAAVSSECGSSVCQGGPARAVGWERACMGKHLAARLLLGFQPTRAICPSSKKRKKIQIVATEEPASTGIERSHWLPCAPTPNQMCSSISASPILPPHLLLCHCLGPRPWQEGSQHRCSACQGPSLLKRDLRLPEALGLARGHVGRSTWHRVLAPAFLKPESLFFARVTLAIP